MRTSSLCVASLGCSLRDVAAMLLTKAPDKKVNKMQKIAELLEKAGKLASDTGRREGVWARHATYMVTTSPGDGLRHIKAPTWDKSGAKCGGESTNLWSS